MLKVQKIEKVNNDTDINDTIKEIINEEVPKIKRINRLCRHYGLPKMTYYNYINKGQNFMNITLDSMTKFMNVLGYDIEINFIKKSERDIDDERLMYSKEFDRLYNMYGSKDISININDVSVESLKRWVDIINAKTISKDDKSIAIDSYSKDDGNSKDNKDIKDSL